jgi:hypothetical protein
MGFLSDGGGAPEVASTETSEEPAEGAEAAEATPEAEQIDHTPVERVTLSRKETAIQKRNAIEKQIESLSNTVKETATKHQAELAEARAESARIRGTYDALVPFLQQRQSPGPTPAAPDSQALLREANAALDKSDMGEYHRLLTASILAGLPQQQAQAPQQQSRQASPVVQAMLGQFPAVVDAGDRGLQLAIIEDQKLGLLGIPDGPARYRKAFELASNQLAPQGAPQYSQQSRQVLSGVPPARSAGGSSKGEPGVSLSSFELKWAEAAGMSKEEYAKAIAEKDPKRLER